MKLDYALCNLEWESVSDTNCHIETIPEISSPLATIAPSCGSRVVRFCYEVAYLDVRSSGKLKIASFKCPWHHLGRLKWLGSSGPALSFRAFCFSGTVRIQEVCEFWEQSGNPVISICYVIYQNQSQDQPRFKGWGTIGCLFFTIRAGRHWCFPSSWLFLLHLLFRFLFYSSK